MAAPAASENPMGHNDFMQTDTPDVVYDEPTKPVSVRLKPDEIRVLRDIQDALGDRYLSDTIKRALRTLLAPFSDIT